MSRRSSARVLGTRWTVVVCLLAAMLSSRPAMAIEMFTFFGDGSRIGLPNLEVPIEAYPGIPLRSDRIRARRRSMQNQGQPVRVGPPGGITIRAMPAGQAIPAPK
jgi:hypothetical protein